MHYGMDIGGTKIEAACFDENFNKVASQRTNTPTEDYSQFLTRIKKLIFELDERFQTKGSVGIGLPGVLNHETGLLISSNITCANGRKAGDDLTEVLGRPVAIENDCRCFAYSEAVGGSADTYSRVFGVILGTGAGGGMCIDKIIYNGAANLSGEWGHLPLPASLQHKYDLPLWDCGCRLTGCYERYIAGPGLSRLYQHFSGKEASAPEIVKRLRKGKQDAKNTFDCFIDITGAALANLVLTLNPDAFVLGGGLSKVAEIYDCLPAAIERHLFQNAVVPAVLPPEYGDSGGVRGAAILGSRLVV